MIGDRAKHCAFILNGMAENLNVDEEAVKEISKDALKDIDELIEKANRVDELEKELCNYSDLINAYKEADKCDYNTVLYWLNFAIDWYRKEVSNE